MMIVINLILSLLGACGNHALVLNISKGPESGRSYRANIIGGLSILDVYKDPKNKENILEGIRSLKASDSTAFFKWIENKDFLKELVFIVKKQTIEIQSEFYQIFNTIYSDESRYHPIQQIYYCFTESVYYDVIGSLLVLRNEQNALLVANVFNQAIKSKILYVTEHKEGMSAIKQLDIQGFKEEKIKETIEQIAKIRIPLDSANELLERTTLFLKLMPSRELEGTSKLKTSIREILNQISSIYGKLEVTSEMIESFIKLTNNANSFLFEALPYLETDFLENISSNKEQKVDNFFKFVLEEYESCRYRGELEEFVDCYLKDKDSVRKYCKKLVKILPVYSLAWRYLKRSIGRVDTLQSLFELFKDNIAKEQKITFSFTQYLWSKSSSTAIDGAFWLLSDLLSVSDLKVMTLADGKLIHEYLALSHPEHLVAFFYNLRDSLDDDATKDSIFSLAGRGPNFRILLLNEHGIKKFRQVDKELWEKIGKDVLIFYDNNPQMMLVALFKKYAEEYQADTRFELGSILIEYCAKLFSKYLDIFAREEFNLFIKLRDQKLPIKESELDRYNQKIRQDILLQALKYPNSRIIDGWSISYQESESNYTARPQLPPNLMLEVK